MNSSFYFDSAATTPLSDGVLQAIQNAAGSWGNPNSRHHYGQAAKSLINKAKEQAAQTLKVRTSQLFFSRGGSEGNQRIIRFFQQKYGNESVRASLYEHSSITELVTDSQLFDPEKITTIDTTMRLVCLMRVNNETGFMPDINVVKKYFPQAAILQDSVQALGKIPLQLEVTSAPDFVTFSAHKIRGPKGVGLIYVKNPYKFNELHDNHTIDTMNICGLGQAFVELRGVDYQSIANLSQYLETLLEDIPDIKIHHADKKRCPGIVSVTFAGVRGHEIAKVLDYKYKYAVSTGSACSTDEPISRIIRAIEPDVQWQYPIRISFGKDKTKADLEKFVAILKEIVTEIRQLEILS